MKKILAFILVLVLALSLVACSKGGETPNGDNTNPGTVTKTPNGGDTITGANGLGEYGGNLANINPWFACPFSYGDDWIFYSPDQKSLYKISNDGKTVQQMDLSTLLSIEPEIKNYPLFHPYFQYYNGKVTASGVWISADGNDAGFGGASIDDIIFGNNVFSVNRDVDPENLRNSYKNVEEAENAKKVKAILKQPVSNLFIDYNGDWEEQEKRITPSLLKAFQGDPEDTEVAIAYVNETYVYYTVSPYIANTRTPKTFFRIKHDGTEETKIFEYQRKYDTDWGYMNFVGDYIFYTDGSELFRVKTDGTEQPETIFVANIKAINSAGDYLYFLIDGTHSSSKSPFNNGTAYIGKMKIADVVPEQSVDELFTKTEKFDTGTQSVKGANVFDKLFILGDWIFYNSNNNYYMMIKTDFTGHADFNALIGGGTSNTGGIPGRR